MVTTAFMPAWTAYPQTQHSTWSPSRIAGFVSSHVSEHPCASVSNGVSASATFSASPSVATTATANSLLMDSISATMRFPKRSIRTGTRRPSASGNAERNCRSSSIVTCSGVTGMAPRGRTVPVTRQLTRRLMWRFQSRSSCY